MRKGVPWFEMGLLAVIFVCLGISAKYWIAENRAVGDVGSSYDESAGGFLAWYTLLERESLKVERFASPAFALGDTKVRTLIIGLSSLSIGAPALRAEIGDLNDFVRSGGSLILLGRFDAATVRQFPFLRSKSFPGSMYSSASLIAPVLRNAGVRSVVIPSRLRFVPERGIQVLLGDHYGPYAVTKRIGTGNIVAFAGADLFLNSDIGERDNARLAYAMATFGGVNARIAFDERFHGYDTSKPLWLALRPQVRIAVILLILAALFWLASEGVRLGRAVDLEASNDPSTGAYLTSLATLYGKARADDVVIRASAGAIEHLVAHDTARLTEKERADYAQLLAYASAGSAGELIPAVRLAVDLRKAMVHNAKRSGSRRTAS